MIVSAVMRATSDKIASKEWYDALALTPEDAKFRREIDINERKMRQATELGSV